MWKSCCGAWVAESVGALKSCVVKELWILMSSFPMDMQIVEHYSAHVAAKVEMTLEKLQLVTTAAVEPKYKIRWLKWWNSPSFVRSDLRFPKSPAGEDTLKKWLDRASFWAGIEETATKELGAYLALAGGVDASKVVDSFEDYLANWRICLWDKAYNTHFMGPDAYHKSSKFEKVKDGEFVVKRLCLRLVIHPDNFVLC